MIHNGIIENYAPLKQVLLNKGHQFHSDTDSEVLLNFIDDILSNNKCTLEEAVRIALKRIVGTDLIVLLVFRAIVQSREKDMTNPFRKMVYSNDVEMETVLGKLSENTFIIEKERGKKEFVSTIESILVKLNLDLVPGKNYYAVDDSYSIF